MSEQLKRALVIGGSNGIGLAIALELAQCYECIYIIDKTKPNVQLPLNIRFETVNLLDDDFGFLSHYDDIDTLIYTAGFGRVAPFDNIIEQEITNLFQVNAISVFKVLNHYYPRLKKHEPFFCLVMGSIAGLVSSPLFALYSATKAAVCRGIESINIELEMSGTDNRILNVSPGSIKGTRFNGGENKLDLTASLANEIVTHMLARETLFIPDYEKTFKGVIERYNTDAHQFGIDSFQYKMRTGRMNLNPQL